MREIEPINFSQAIHTYIVPSITYNLIQEFLDTTLLLHLTLQLH